MTHARPILAIVVLFCLAASPARAGHPLDGPTAEEIRTAIRLLASEGHAGEETLVADLALVEPPKSEVLAWGGSESVPRRVKAILLRDGKVVEAVVDLDGEKVTSARELEDVQPPVTLPEIFRAIELTLGDPRVQEALAKRDIEADPEKVFCAPRTVGNFGEDAERTRRLAKVDCFDVRAAPTNAFATPIEGLFATVDLVTGEVVEVTDTGVVPIPPGAFTLSPEATGTRARKPIVVSAPEGTNVRVEDSFVTWGHWRFHLRWEMRSGLVVSLVSRDGRPVLYQGHLSEIFVPYQDPTRGWYFRNYMDEGDFGLGTMATPLVRGSDCPESAVYLAPAMVTATGEAATLDDRICIFERPTAEPTWRHFDVFSEALDSRPDVDLVVRTIATVGNYDYLFDWIFDAKGRLTFRAGATGLDAVKGVEASSLAAPTATADTAWGPLVAPGRAGINHDHFFSVRLDLDVDGPENRFVRDRLVAGKPEQGPRRSLWRVERAVTEKEPATYRLSYEMPSLWRVESNRRTNDLGYPTSYWLKPGPNALPLVEPDDPALARAAFANHHLWVTAYDPDERFAAGAWPNQSEPGAGLPEWSRQGRKLDGEDIVLWYTMGFHHVPSAEDWPVYNVGWHAVTLQPYNFHGSNPAIDVPPAPAAGDAGSD